MQQRKPSTGQVTGRRATASRQQNNQQQNPTTDPIKEQEENLLGMVREYLDKNGYPRTFQSLKHEKPVKKSTGGYGVHRNSGNQGQDEQKSLLLHFDKGHRQQFFKQAHKIFSSTQNPSSTANFNNESHHHQIRKLQFQLNIYFCIYSIHPCINPTNYKKASMDKSAVEAFKKFIDTKGSEISEENQLLSFFALPYVPKPQQNPGMAKVFTKEWITKLRNSVIETNKEHNNSKKLSSQNSQNKENNKKAYNSSLQEFYDKYLQLAINQKKQKEVQDQCFNPKHTQELQNLRKHNIELISIIDSIQQNLKDLNEASKVNLVESNRKWFQFSKQILQLAKRSIKNKQDKSSLEKLERYQKFFGSNIDDLIYSSADISLFEKNSYTDDTNIYDISKKMGPADNINRQQTLCQIDTNKILNLFSRANNPELSKQICLVLKALKNRLYFHKNAHTRREVIVSYQRNDMCAIKECNYHYQKKLLFEGGDCVRQFYLRLINHISTDNLGNQYLSASEKLIENLIGIMGQTTQDVSYRKHVFGLLQRFSFIKQSQLIMISFGIIPMIFKVFRSEGQCLQYSSIQYLMGLIMNLAINKESIKNFQKHKSQIIPILLKYIDMDDAQIQGFINGTLYVLLQLKSIKQEAVERYKMQEIIQQLLEKAQFKLKQLESNQEINEQNQHNDSPQNQIDDCNIVIRQYNYILQRLQEKDLLQFEEAQYDGYLDTQEEQEDFDDLQEIDLNSDNQSTSSDYLEGEDNTLSGEELLLKKYALLGPEAVREQLLTRSILDETGRKSHNMTTSINHSKRIDRVFNKNERIDTPSLLPNNLDLSINPGK